MRIDPSNRPEAQNRLIGANTPEQTGATAAGKSAEQTNRVETAEAVHESYIRQAAACSDVDMKAVAEARKLLDSGQLDTAEAITRAAESIIDRGI